MLKVEGLSRSSVLTLKRPLLLVIYGSLWRILSLFKHAFLILLLIVLSISFLPFSHLFLIRNIGVVGFMVNPVTLQLHS